MSQTKIVSILNFLIVIAEQKRLGIHIHICINFPSNFPVLKLSPTIF